MISRIKCYSKCCCVGTIGWELSKEAAYYSETILEAERDRQKDRDRERERLTN